MGRESSCLTHYWPRKCGRQREWKLIYGAPVLCHKPCGHFILIETETRDSTKTDAHVPLYRQGSRKWRPNLSFL